MKKLLLFSLCLFLLVSCGEPELPPNPPAPGEVSVVGQAIGGIPITSQLPSWAAPIKYTDISPTLVNQGDKLTFVIEKPSGLSKTFYAHAIAYVYNKKFKIWEKAVADSSKSGSITKNWAKDKATFYVPITSDRFLPGPNYIVTYWCIDTGNRDDKGYKIWDCNNRKWGLGAFEMNAINFPDILIEQDIENNRYKSSAKATVSAGTIYTASYTHITNYNVDVSVLKLNNVDSFKQDLLNSYPSTSRATQWMKRGNVCGFLTTSSGKTVFSWLSGSNWLSVITYKDLVDDAKIGKYGIKYPSDCGLLDWMNAQVGCGNSKIDSGEECDKTADSACPGACKPNCKCGVKGDPNFGFCGDLIIQQPNSKGEFEDCEPPGSRDPVTSQMVGDSCFLRSGSTILGVGACDEKCKCINATAIPSLCGDGKADPGEQCGEPTLGPCAVGEMCSNCKCIPVPPTCGNGVSDAGEQCDPGKPGVACAGGKTCTANCLCVDKKLACGDGIVSPPENCDPGKPGRACPPGGICMACQCVWLKLPNGPAPWINISSFCGNGLVDSVMGEECEADIQCANPPGGIVSPTCDKSTCKCNKVCGDGKVQAPNSEGKNEACDPPGRPSCPPIQVEGGGCAIPLCDEKCGCPTGPGCPAGVPVCGDGKVEAPETCEKPGDPCGCGIGPNGAIACFLCSGTCGCDNTKIAPSGCPGADCGKPSSGIILDGSSYDGFGFGIHSTTYDGKFTVAGSPSQCWTTCAESVIKLKAVDEDGADVTKDGKCYYVSGVASGLPWSTVIEAGTQQATLSTSVTSMKSRCRGSSSIEESVVQNNKCELRSMSCPPGTACSETSTGAVCATIALGSGPAVPSIWVKEFSCTGGQCPNLVNCPNNPAGQYCEPYNARCKAPTTVQGTYDLFICTTNPATSGPTPIYTAEPETYYVQVPETASLAGHAILTEAPSAASKGIQIALFMIAAMGILVVTLLNFLHRE